MSSCYLICSTDRVEVEAKIGWHSGGAVFVTSTASASIARGTEPDRASIALEGHEGPQHCRLSRTSISLRVLSTQSTAGSHGPRDEAGEYEF